MSNKTSVVTELVRLSESLSQLEYMLITLHDRLSPIILHSPQEEYRQSSKDLSMCRLAEEIYALNDKVELQIRYVESMAQNINLEESCDE